MDVTKRWVNEAQEAVNSDNVMVQYHALGLLYHIRKHDKLAVTKLVQKFTRGQLKSPYAMCLLVIMTIWMIIIITVHGIILLDLFNGYERILFPVGLCIFYFPCELVCLFQNKR